MDLISNYSFDDILESQVGGEDLLRRGMEGEEDVAIGEVDSIIARASEVRGDQIVRTLFLQ